MHRDVARVRSVGWSVTLAVEVLLEDQRRGDIV